VQRVSPALRWAACSCKHGWLTWLNSVVMLVCSLSARNLLHAPLAGCTSRRSRRCCQPQRFLPCWAHCPSPASRGWEGSLGSR
jgi:hypothetical protein